MRGDDRSDVHLGQLPRQRDRTLLSLRGEGACVAAVDPEHDLVSVGPDMLERLESSAENFPSM